MSLIPRQDALQTLSYALFELTGEKLFEIYRFIVRNPYISRFLRQKYGKKRAGKVRRGNELFAPSAPRLQRKPISQSMVEDDDDYELPTDAPYIPVEENTTAAAEKAKLETLEAELNRLRAEMAQFMQAASAGMNSSTHAGTSASSPGPSNYTYDQEASSSDETPHTPVRRPATAPPAGLAPPAPPLPPPTPVQNLRNSFNKVNREQPVETKKLAPKVTSLSDMVKSSSRDSLRKVEGERSPGGTVKQDKKPRVANPNNPADIIAQALRKRFKSVSGSPTSSPDAKQVQSRLANEHNSEFDE